MEVERNKQHTAAILRAVPGMGPQVVLRGHYHEKCPVTVLVTVDSEKCCIQSCRGTAGYDGSPDLFLCITYYFVYCTLKLHVFLLPKKTLINLTGGGMM